MAGAERMEELVCRCLRDCTSQYIHCLSPSERTSAEMDSQLALEALGALLGVTVKPMPETDIPAEGVFPPQGPLEGLFSPQRPFGGVASLAGPLLNTITIGDAAPSRRTVGDMGLNKIRRGGPAVNKLTVETFLSILIDLDFQSQVLNDSAGQIRIFSPQNSAADISMRSTSDLQKELFVNMDEFFDQKFDYDFRRGSDSSECSRGGEPYARPWGWYRFALNVLDKYPDGNSWLGPIGWRDESVSGEWPVSFHGTGADGAKAIARSCFQPGPRDLYGPGIYSTPDITIASWYTKQFESKNGKKYKVIMQNRINPEERKIIEEKKDYWLIPIPEGTQKEEVKKIAMKSIRPYGILIKEVK
ncbi:hypothetical protein MHYP_G00356460 [Metynnis hypsauchen]